MIFIHLLTYLLTTGAREGSAESGRGPCDAVECPFHGVCHVVDNSARCICRGHCDNDDDDDDQDPVCGTDGLTYPSVCQLRLIACRQQSPVQVAYYAPCTGQIALYSINQSISQFY